LSPVVWASLTKRRVVPPDERAVQRGADARVGLGADDDESPDSEARQHGLEGGVLEGVTVVLLDERLGIARSQLGDDPPVVAPPRKLLVGVLDPDNGDVFPPCLLDKAADLRDDRIALVSLIDDAVLHIDDEEGGVGPVLECRHDLPRSRWALVSLTVEAPTVSGRTSLGARHHTGDGSVRRRRAYHADVDDQQILGQVHELVAEEHRLREQQTPLTSEQRARLAHVEQDLDQCWDVLRQRRARREYGENPDDAEARPHSEVEGYLQ